jgi:hypothetical protein
MSEYQRKKYACVEANFLHNLSIYDRQVRMGYKPVEYPTTSLVMGNHVRSVVYVHDSQHLLKRVFA